MLIAMLECAACNAIAGIEQLPQASQAEVALSATFPNQTPECAACVREGCTNELAACVGDVGCDSFFQCRHAGELSPSSELVCGRDYLGPGGELSTARSLRSCWANRCIDECRLGTNWDCVGNHTPPPREASNSASVTQSLERLNSPDPIEGVVVRFCGFYVPNSDCATLYDRSAVTDVNGTCTVDLPLPIDGGLGWAGYRQISHVDLFPARLYSNLVIPFDRYMVQQVLTQGEALVIARLSGADIALGNVLFQIYDCAQIGAENVVVDVASEGGNVQVADARTIIRYTQSRSLGDLSTDATRSEGGGAGAVLNLAPDELIRFTARRRDTGENIATTSFRPSANEIVYLEIHPDPR